MPVDAVRDAAIDVLLRVFERDAFLNVSLDKTLRRKDISERGRRFLTQLVYGTVRHKLLADHVLAQIVEQPLDLLPRPIHCIMRMGVFQALFCAQVTFPAMVHTSVDLAKKRGNPGTARLVNAVLKRVPQKVEDAQLPSRKDDFVNYLRIRYSTPRWIVAQWLDQFGAPDAESLCAASNEAAPTTLRVNTELTSVEELQAALNKSGYTISHATSVPEELTILDGPPPTRSKRFLGGHFMMQDPAAMLAAHLLQPEAGDRVLDMCAAPGGKTTHVAQMVRGRAQIVALDAHLGKFALVRENVERMKCRGIVSVCADGTRPPFGARFSKVLVDAPCTGLGTLRRHPELKWRVRREHSDEMMERQCALLRSAIRLCENGGVLVYVVCTLSRPETEGVTKAILGTEPVHAEDGPAWLNPWKIAKGIYRTLPHRDGMDGFYLMRLRKSS